MNKILVTFLLSCVAVLAACGDGSNGSGSAPASDVVASVGPEFPGGDGHAVPVSDRFGAVEAKALADQLNTPDFRKMLTKYAGGDVVAEYKFHVTLCRAMDYGSRRVEVSYFPAISNSGRSRCLAFGMFFQIDFAVVSIDPLKKFTRKYVKPTGEVFEVPVERYLIEPQCDWSKQASGEEWVLFPEATTKP